LGNFRELRVWQKSKKLAVEIYGLTEENERFSKDFRFKDQLRRCSISIPSNIAEGDELMTNKQANRHFHIARGSAAEAITQIIIAHEIGYVTKDQQDYFIDAFEHISSMLNKLIKKREL